MKKRLSLNSGGIKNVIKRSLSNDFTISESKIDAIIKEYLFERSEYDYEDYRGVKDEFSPKSIEAIDDMVFGLNEMIDDLDIIKEKESDVLVEADYYADEYLNNIVESLRDIIENLEHLSSLTRGSDTIDNKEENLDV